MIKQDIKKALVNIIHEFWGSDSLADLDIEVVKPNNNQGDYANSSAFGLGKKLDLSPAEIASKLVQALDGKIVGVSRIESAGGFVNFFVTPEYLHEELLNISKQENYGASETLKGKTIMVEFTDPNPFKLFHIGHLMSNTIGESIARLYEALGARVLRVNWQGDVGIHIAMAVWAIKAGKVGNIPADDAPIMDRVNYLGRAYTAGSLAYRDGGPKIKAEIEAVNAEIYAKDNSEVVEIYNKGKTWSLDYFEEIYKRLGTKFDHYFFESEIGPIGLEIVKQNPEVFKESEGAIVFKGEEYGLHTRVFVNSKGLPVYEAKELGLNKTKFDLYHPELSIIITGNEINEYFKVLLKVMSLIMPEVAEKTRHIGHGMMRLTTGKMSSRTGDVVTADALIEQTKAKLKDKESVQTITDPKERENTAEAIAIGAIKYSILKQSPGKDIVFDFEKSLAIKGDSGPYLQYTYSRLFSILKKAEQANFQFSIFSLQLLKEESELNLIKYFLEFPEAVREASEMIAPQRLALYLFELANLANNFYENVHILEDEDSSRMSARLLLVRVTAEILSRGLAILGIKTPVRI